MAVNVNFLTGQEENLPIDIKNGNVYFAITSEENQVGKIYFDNNGKRYAMSSPSSEVANKVAFALTIGDIVYDGSEAKSVPIYDGSII